MYPEQVSVYSRARRISLRDAAQTFMQVVALRHLSEPGVRLMGGAALVLGHGNPRFSEDIDLTQVPDPDRLRAGVLRARSELEGWLGAPVTIRSPRAGGRTWRLTARFGRSESLSLHVDSKPFRAYASRPLVIEFPSLPPLVFSALHLDEIMSEKLVAVARRRYLGGRDLFDLWFHWMRSDAWEDRRAAVIDLLARKLDERGISQEQVGASIRLRLSERASLSRAREEWKRYLPADFRKIAVLNEIVARCRLLAGVVP
jgi:predicted nucleotidyltransferase component of viral defense system